MVRKLLSLDIEKVMEITEGFLKDNSMKYEFEPFYTRYGLRIAEYKLGFLKKIKLINYGWGVEVKIPRSLKRLESILSVYELRLPEKPKIKDRWDYVLELQIYEKKLEMARKAIMFRTPVTLALILIGAITKSIPSPACIIALFVLIVPTWKYGGSFPDFAEPSEWAIPILYPHYKAKVKELRNTLTPPKHYDYFIIFILSLYSALALVVTPQEIYLPLTEPWIR